MPLRIIRVGDEDVIRFDLLIHGGQWNQRMPLQAMFTNRMLREGTRTLTSAAIAEKLDYYGAWLDLSSSVNYGFVTLYSLGKYFPQTIEILASMIKEPTFPEKELNIVTDVNRQQYLVNCQRVEVWHASNSTVHFSVQHILWGNMRRRKIMTGLQARIFRISTRHIITRTIAPLTSQEKLRMKSCAALRSISETGLGQHRFRHDCCQSSPCYRQTQTGIH